MNRHEGITCTVCRKTNFCGPRYKCLRCYNFDLCYVCYYQRVTSNQHTPDHPMQCIISDAHFELPSGEEPVARGYQAQSLVPQSSLPPISKDYVLPFDTFWPPERDGTVRTPSSLFRRSHERTGCLPASLLGVDLALLSGCGFWSLDTPNTTSPPPLNLLSAEPPLQNAANKPELDDEKFVESSIDSLAELSGSPLLPLTIPPPIPSTDHSDMTFTVLCPVREINSSSSSDIATDDSTEHLCSAHRHVNDSLSAESLVSRTSSASISEDYKLPFDTFWPPERDGTVRTPSSLFRRSHERTGCLPASLLGVDLALLSGCGFWSLDTPNTTSSPPLNLLSAEPPLQNAANKPELDDEKFVESSIDSLAELSGSPLLPLTIPPPIPSTDHSDMTFTVLCPVREINSSSSSDIATDDSTEHLCSAHRHVNDSLSAESLVSRTSSASISEDYKLPFDTFWPPERDGTVRTPSSLFRRSHERTGCLPASLLGVDLALLSGCGFWSLDTPNTTSSPPLNLLSAEPPLQNAANKPELDDEKFVESSIDSLAELSGSPLLPLTIPPPIPSTDHSDMTFTVLCPVREINSSSSSDIATDDSTEHLCSAHRHVNDSLSAESLVSRTSSASISEDYKLPFDTFWPPERDGTVRTPSSLFRRSHERTGCLPASLLGVDLALLSGCGFWSLDTPNTTSSPPLNLLSAEPPIQNAANEPELDGDEFVESSIDSLEQHPNEDRW